MKTLLTGLLTLMIGLSFSSNAHALLRVITIGDSITSGLKLNASKTDWYCPADGVRTSSFYACRGNNALNRGGYQPHTRTLFAQNGINADLYNWGINGAESWQLNGVATQAMNARPADVVFIMAGVNDLNDNVSAHTTAFSIELIMDTVRARGLKVVVGTVTPHAGVSSYNAKIAQINGLIKTAAAARKIPVADHFSTFITNWNAYHSGDGLHINNTGDAVMASKWVAAYDEISVVISPVLRLLLD